MLILQIITGVFAGILSAALSVKCIHLLQLLLYKPFKYLRNALSPENNYFKTIIAIAVLGFGSVFLTSLFLSGAFIYFGLLPFALLSIGAVIYSFKQKSKVPLRFTPRVIRLLFLVAVLEMGINFAVLYFTGVLYLPVFVITLPLVVALCAVLISPIEWLNKQFYILKARKKLFSREYKDLIRIGITGSFGKTSCKNILCEMLEQKYTVVPSPHSFNTPMGFCITVLKNLTPDTQVLIMEMGARRRGDIKQMCKLFKPTNGLLTSIGAAHLETFKTIENIRAEKMELLNSIPEGGIKIDGTAVEAKHWDTKLLGEHNQKNISICAEMAVALGVEDEKINRAVANLKPVPHRLELIESNGIKIIDDTYNSCPVSAAAAVKTLGDLKRQNPAARAVVMTPGMVELGLSQYDENFALGKSIAAADKVIIVGTTNKVALAKGLEYANFNADDILYAETVEAAKLLFPKVLSAGDILLMENDLPDNF
jgi:UDP-N-acetylmuramoyl-tripeptide--D-alanyl-D-alanine ligase